MHAESRRLPTALTLVVELFLITNQSTYNADFTINGVPTRRVVLRNFDRGRIQPAQPQPISLKLFPAAHNISIDKTIISTNRSEACPIPDASAGLI